MGDERNLRYELLDAARGKAPRTDFWKKEQGFDSYFSGAGSQNIWLLRSATQALKGRPILGDAVYHYQLGPPAGTRLVSRGGSVQATAAEAGTDRVYTHGFGGSEFMSTIYWSWHLMSHLALLRHPGPIAKQARRWVILNWVLFRAIQAHDGSLLLFGQRSAGHNPIPREVDWFFALASDGDVQRAERWCKQAGAGLKRSWEFEMGQEMRSEMRETYKESLSIPVEDLPKLLPLRVPTDIVRTTEGIAVVHAGNCNPNTPPILAGTLWKDGRREILPTSDVRGEKVPGGVRIRQKFDHATARIEGREIVYSSSLYTNGAELRIPLPDGDVIYHLRLGDGDSAPVVDPNSRPDPNPKPDPNSRPDPGPSPDPGTDRPPVVIPIEPDGPPGDEEERDLERAADLIAGLLLPHRQKPLQGEVIAKLRADPDEDEIAEIAAQVRTFGIGPGQPQAVQWREAILILED